MLSHIIIVILCLFPLDTNTDSKIREALALSIKGEYEESELLLKKIKEEDVSLYNLYHFTRLLNNFTANNKAVAEIHSKALEESFIDDLPIRYKALANIMSDDLKTWKPQGLGDIGRDMKTSTNRLGNAKGGEKTQNVQKDIVNKLDRLIKDNEDKKSSKKEQEDKDGEKIPVQAQPAKDANVPPENGPGKIADNWGTLPPSERKRIEQEFTREMPAKYKPMIEEYFNSLNKINKK
jgi:hypothetical protein